MGLVQTLIEKAGIATVSVSVLAEVTRDVAPPRVLFVDRPLGYPLDQPGDVRAQRAVIEAALRLTASPVSEPMTRHLGESGPQWPGENA